MTYDEFLVELRDASDQVVADWQLVEGGYLRGICSGLSVCPITAVFAYKARTILNVRSARYCAQQLGLEYDDWSDIIHAADGGVTFEERGIRKDLWKAVGLPKENWPVTMAN